jgi:anti-sigma regulatory factor (Ser/Thr protein kinase)
MAIKTRGPRLGGIETQGRDGLRMRLGSGPEAAAEARRAIAGLRADLDPPLMETMRLLVTELVTNAVRHTDCDTLTLRVAIGRSGVLTEVSDQGPLFDIEEVEEGAAAPNTGWGLFLVERLANGWGVTEDGGRKRVWFELRRA